MQKRYTPILALILSLFMSVSTLSNTYQVFADEQIPQEETVEQNTDEEVVEKSTEDESIENTDENDDIQNDEQINDDNEQLQVEEQLGDAKMMEYFLVDNPIGSSSEAENFVLSLKAIENYSNFYITVQKNDGTNYDVQSSEQVDNLIKFSEVFASGDYSVTQLHYLYNGQKYYLNFSDLGMNVKFGIDQEYSGYDATIPDLTEDNEDDAEIPEGVVTITDVNNTEEEVANGIISTDPDSWVSALSLDSETKSNNGVTICLDPGHGGNDGGATGVNGVQEKNLTFKIAQYCMNELKKYKCNVYLTRTGDTNPSLQERADIAKKYGASYLISIHLNSSTTNTSYGAEVYYPNTNWRPDLSSNGKNVAQAIQKELTKLGIYNRGIKFLTIDTNIYKDPFRYDDGSVADHYGIIRNAKYNGLTGLIIEHCFVNNYSDYNNYLSSDTKLQMLGVADANGIVSALGLSKKESFADYDKLAKANKDVIKDGTYQLQLTKDKTFVMTNSNNGNVQVNSNKNTADQAWVVSHTSDGYVMFQNKNTGKFMDVNNGNAASGENVISFTKDGGRNQKWIVLKDGNGYRIVSGLDTDLSLDMSTGVVKENQNIEIYQSNNRGAQNWTFTSYVSKGSVIDQMAASNKNVIKDGTYQIQLTKNKSYVMTNASNGNLQVNGNRNADSQAWIVSHTSDGYVMFQNKNTGKFIDVNNGNASSGENVITYKKNGGRNQKWIVLKDGNGYRIVSAMNQNLSLDMYTGNVVENQNIDIYQNNDRGAQNWTFTTYVSREQALNNLAVSNKNTISDGTYQIQLTKNKSYVMTNASNGNLQVNGNRNADSQAWIVSHTSDGYVMFQNKNTGKFIDVNNGNASSGENVITYKKNGGRNQKWIVLKDGNGYRIVSAMNQNLSLDMYTGNVVENQNIDIYQNNDRGAQNWTFTTYVSREQALNNLAVSNKNTISDGTYQIQLTKNKSYVMTNASNGNLQVNGNRNADSQAWIVSHTSDGYVMFQNKNTGKFIDVNNGNASSGENVITYKKNGGRNQKWIVLKDGNGYRIVSAMNQNLSLDMYTGNVVENQNIDIYQNNDRGAQNWTFTTYVSREQALNNLAVSNKNTISDGTYQIQLTKNKSYVMTNASNGNLQVNGNRNADSQAWIVSHTSDGYVMFQNKNTGKFIDVNNGNASSGENVITYKKNGGRNQKWIVLKDGNGYRIVSAMNQNLSLDMYTGNVVENQNIDIYQNNDRGAQNWCFITWSPLDSLTKIMGKITTSVDQMVRYYNSVRKDYDTYSFKDGKQYNGVLSKGGAKNIREFAQIFYEEAQAEGIRAEVAFAQTMKETGFLKFGGQVKPNQYNFAGLGALTGGGSGASFKDVRTGIRAQIQHLKAYASLNPLINPCVDPRFNLVSPRGSAQYVEWLGQKENPNGKGWATSEKYGYSLLDYINTLLSK